MKHTARGENSGEPFQKSDLMVSSRHCRGMTTSFTVILSGGFFIHQYCQHGLLISLPSIPSHLHLNYLSPVVIAVEYTITSCLPNLAIFFFFFCPPSGRHLPDLPKSGELPLPLPTSEFINVIKVGKLTRVQVPNSQ